MTRNSHILPDKGATITLHRNNPDLPNTTCLELTSHGIGVVDFGMGMNLDPEASDDQAETRAKQTLLDISAGGAYGAIHAEDREVVVVGRAPPSSLRFLELENVRDTTRVYPAYQFERFGEVPESGSELFTKLQEAIKNRLQMPTLYQPDEGADGKPGAEMIPKVFVELDRRGQLRRSRR